MKFLRTIVEQYNKQWNNPSWETSVFESIVLATVYVIVVVALVFAPVVGIFSLAFWLIWG